MRRPLFLALWLAYAFFHPGGGWNQNARFAQVRAIVEEARWDVGDHLVYATARREDGALVFARSPLEGGEVVIGDRRYALTWGAAPGAPTLDGRSHPGVARVAVERVAASGDLAWADGRVFPNKAPGTAWLAVPAYALLRALEAPFGWSPDRWRVLTVNAWLTCALSIGLLGALGGVLVYGLALELGGGHRRAALAAALTWGLGTLTWPYATMLYEHVPAAALLAGSVLLLLQAERGRRPALGAALAAGAAAGLGVTTSYLLAPPLLLLALLALRSSGWRAAAAFGAGACGPLLALAVYHRACFGSPWATAYAFQNPEFLGAAPWLGVLQAPRLDRLVLLLVSPFRGLFFGSPVLLLGVVSLVLLAREPRGRRPALLFAALFGFFLLFSCSFNGWHGGWASGPRYLAAALPFMAAPLALSFRRWPRTTGALAALSVAIQLLTVAVDPQPAVGVASIATRPGVARWRQSPLLDYEVPLFLEGRATPILAALGRRGALLASFRGPVSANPTGIYEAWPGRLAALDSREARWNSFNAGEWLAAGSRWSLLPLLLLAGYPAALALRRAGRPRSTDRSS